MAAANAEAITFGLKWWVTSSRRKTVPATGALKAADSPAAIPHLIRRSRSSLF